MIKTILFSFLILFSLTACTSKVKPWEKGILAEKTMQLGGGDPSTKKISLYRYLNS